MELKSQNTINIPIAKMSSNRTFMELKYFNERVGVFGEDVLIVPLWNWNE